MEIEGSQDGNAVAEGDSYKVPKDQDGRNVMTGSESEDLEPNEVEVWLITFIE